MTEKAPAEPVPALEGEPFHPNTPAPVDSAADSSTSGRQQDRAGRAGDHADIGGAFKRIRRNAQLGNVFAALLGAEEHQSLQEVHDMLGLARTLLATSSADYRARVAHAAGAMQDLVLDVAESRPEPVE